MESDIRVSHFFEWEDSITGGHKQSVRNQRKILDERGIEYTKEAELEADILHLNNMGPKSVYLARKAREMKIKVVVHAHQTAEDFRNSFRFSNILSVPMKPYLRYAYSLPDHLICPSEHNREVIEGYSDVAKSVVSNGFDPEKIRGFENLREEYMERFDLDPPVVFMVGHVIERKGLKTFVETAREMPDLDFIWFGFMNPTGNDGLKDRFLRSRKTKKLVESSPDNCKFTGFIEDIRGAFAAGDIFFFPTRNENEGMALLEAMACEKAVLVRDIPTFNWLKDGEECLKAERDFTSKIKKLEDEKLRKKLGKRAGEKSREYRLENAGDRLINVYEKVLEE